MNDPEIFSLTEGERHSALWAKLLRYFEEELRKARVRNDSPLDAVETASLRGEIRRLKGLIALDRAPDLPN